MLRSNQPSGDQDMRSMLARPTPAESTAAPSDPRSRPPEVARNDPRLARGIMPTRPPPTSMAPPRPAPASNAPTTDQDKTALIMQVLQLSDEQIALLPPDQRSSILLLKEQIARSTQR
ncbi:uncharacterized protein LOC113362949 [Ctenocephalides felis]|uniref:uncharacterized protein LOC113362949 n=1 Tax=Ctenocephalides felis TaxID=7515 RepID=UPI000E6E47F3|nr:uncharacterized protein LOC113362949 [Ctenocephalides felis]